MKKRLLAILMSAAMVASLAACSGGTGDNSSTGQTPVSDSGKEEITLTFHLDPESGSADTHAIKTHISDFEAKNPGIKVQFVETPFADYHQKLLNVAAAGSDEFDVCYVETDYVAQLARAGVIEPLDDYVANSSVLKWDDYIAPSIERNMVDGKHYAIPQVADVQTAVYNKVVLDALGIKEPPKTIDEFISYCNKAKAGGYIPLALRYDSNVIPTQLMGLFLFTDGGSLVKKDGDKWVANLNNETGKNWISNCRKIFSTVGGDNLATMDSTKMIEAFNQGKAGCTIAGAWYWDSVDEATSKNLISAPFPKGSGNQVALLSGWNLAVFANSKHKAEAFKVLEWKSDPQVATDTTAGLSGRKDAAEYFPADKKDLYTDYQSLMQYGVSMAPAEFSLRSEVTTALLPAFQEATFSEKLSLDAAAKLCNDAIQKAIDDNQ